MQNEFRSTGQKRRMVRTVSYLTAAALAFAAAAVIYRCRAAKYGQYVENVYQRAFAELSANVDGMGTSLRKAMYITDPGLMSSLCADVYARAMAAQMAMEALPYSDIPLESVSGFIARAGDYAYALSRKTSAGKTPDDEEYGSVGTLCETAEALSQKLALTREQIYSGSLRIDEAFEDASGELSRGPSGESVSETVQLVENDFPEMPSLIYDGPFSEHIEKREAVMLTGRPQVTLQEAADRLTDFLGAEPGSAVYAGEGLSDRIETWCFLCAAQGRELYAQVSKQGGMVLSVLSAHTQGSAVVGRGEAVQKAAAFLEERGYQAVTPTYYREQDGELTVNFAAVQDGAVLYPDLIKVKVALEDGAVTGFDAVGYIMCHYQREIPGEKISPSHAVERISPALRVLSTQLCVIPTAGQNELFCRQFTCETEQGRHCLLFVNAVTGREEKLLLLIEDENGTLTV